MRKYVIIVCLLTLSFFASGQTLMIFGGDNHDVYLGKLNASEYDSESIWNEYSSYGSDYSSYSPFNEYAAYPPVIVDAKGNFYGYFTVNEHKPKRAEFKLALIIYQYYKQIRDDVFRLV